MRSQASAVRDMFCRRGGFFRSSQENYNRSKVHEYALIMYNHQLDVNKLYMNNATDRSAHNPLTMLSTAVLERSWGATVWYLIACKSEIVHLHFTCVIILTEKPQFSTQLQRPQQWYNSQCLSRCCGSRMSGMTYIHLRTYNGILAFTKNSLSQ